MRGFRESLAEVVSNHKKGSLVGAAAYQLAFEHYKGKDYGKAKGKSGKGKEDRTPPAPDYARFDGASMYPPRSWGATDSWQEWPSSGKSYQ